MTSAPAELKYTDQHEWLRVEGKIGTIGITDYAQKALGDITFVELPPVGKKVAKGEEACAIESAKAAASVYAPASGKVIEVNKTLDTDPALVNSDPYGAGWICKIDLSNPSESSSLLSAAQYEDLLKRQEH